MASSQPTAAPFRAVVVGSGVAGLEGALALRALAPERVQVEILTPVRTFTERPLSVLAPFGAHVPRIPLEDLLGDTGIRVRRGRVAAVDLDARMLDDDAGHRLSFDALLVTTGARTVPAVHGAISFGTRGAVGAFRELLTAIDDGSVRRVAFTLPQLASWSLPLYELALLTAAHANAAGRGDVELLLITPEPAPLALFGDEAAHATATLLERAGIELLTQRHPRAFASGAVDLGPGERPVPADAAVALGIASGTAIPGLPADASGFLPVDHYGRVAGTSGVWAAGDCTTFPLKQGGLAAQQAEVAATDIACTAGMQVDLTPFKPIIRGMLLTDDGPRWLRYEPADGGHEKVSDHALWWPPDKLSGTYLPARLAMLHDGSPRALPAGMPVDVALAGLEG
jgi:sulfide:quinone oxidoreductase